MGNKMNKINYQHLFPRIKCFVKNKHWINTSLLNTLYITASLEHDIENKNSRIYIETLICKVYFPGLVQMCR